jgi:HPt (histidine-containing phosphotransfer) domain-containing protein
MPHADPIFSRLGDDPVLGEIVTLFVEEMPARVESLRSQAATHDWEMLGRTAHQLRGALGSHGFNGLTESAQRLEMAARTDAPQPETVGLALDELISLCQRLQAGAPSLT